MPRAHKQADVLTAKRKRVRRAINSLKKSITDIMPESEANARRAYIQRLETQLNIRMLGVSVIAACVMNCISVRTKPPISSCNR